MLISELARRTGASPRSLRHYEANGLLAPVRDPNGYRRYCPAAVPTVLRIKSLLRLGLSLDAIGPVLPCVTGDVPDPCAELVATLETELGRLDAVVAEATEARAAIRAVLAQARRAAA